MRISTRYSGSLASATASTSLGVRNAISCRRLCDDNSVNMGHMTRVRNKVALTLKKKVDAWSEAPANAGAESPASASTTSKQTAKTPPAIVDRLNDAIRERGRGAAWQTFLTCHLPWLVAAAFLFLWLFDVGRGGLDREEIGTVGQWATAVAAIGALVIAVTTLLRERQLSIHQKIDALYKEWTAELDVNSGRATAEARRESARTVPVVISHDRQDDGTGVLRIEVHNARTEPLTQLAVRMDTVDHLSLSEIEELHTTPHDQWPPGVLVFELANGQTVAAGACKVVTMPISAENFVVVEEHGQVVVTWSLGMATYTHHEAVTGGSPTRKVKDEMWSDL